MVGYFYIGWDLEGRYLGGGWAVRVPEGQVRRRVVGEGLGEGVSFARF